MILFWVVCIMATLVIADQKKLSIGTYLVLALLLGPLAVIIALAVSSQKITVVKNVQDMRAQLGQLKNQVFVLQEKINNLEASFNNLRDESLPPEIERQPKAEMVSTPLPEEAKSETIEEKISVPQETDMELNFGRNWLNKIGIVIFTLGMGFLISYTFKYFGPFLKILFGYLVGAALFYWGTKLRAQEKFIHFRRAVLGGAWAVVYFTTYAMHHFEASRIIENQIVDLFLLAVVVTGMILHVLKYKSEGMMSLALFVAYLTATLGQINSFTFISCLLLALVVLFLMYHLQWIKTFILGVLLTYGIHCLWVMPRIESSPEHVVLLGISTTQYHLLLNFIFLSAYGLVFLIGAHLCRFFKESKLVDTLAAVNFGNIAIYSALAYPMVLKLFYAQRFALVLATGILYLVLGLAMKRLGREKLYLSDMVAAVFVITFSLPLKFLPTSTILLWLIEVPFLLFIGFRYQEKIYRWLSYSLFLVITVRIFYVLVFEHMVGVHFLGFVWSWAEFISLWASIAAAVNFYLTRRFEEVHEPGAMDWIFGHVFSISSVGYLTFLVTSLIEQPYFVLALSIEGVTLLALSVLLNINRYRVYSYFILGGAVSSFIFDIIYGVSPFMKWLIIGVEISIFFSTYFIMKNLFGRKQVNRLFDTEETLTFWAGLLILVVAIFQHLPAQGISLSLGVAGVVIVLIGILNKDKIERLGGLILLGLTLGRVFFVDLSGLDIILKIITFMILGILFVGISFIYNRFNLDQKDKNNP